MEGHVLNGRESGQKLPATGKVIMGVKGGQAQSVHACVLSVYSLFARMPETALYMSVCLVRCNSNC